MKNKTNVLTEIENPNISETELKLIENVFGEKKN